MKVVPAGPARLVPINGKVLLSDTRLEPGVYLLPDGLTIDADDVTLDGNGVVLVGEGRRGVGINVNGRRNVTIRNVRLREYGHGIAARGTQGLTIEGCQITATAEVEANTIFLDIWRPAEDAYGGAILLDAVKGAEIQDNDLQHQFAGLLAYHCQELNIRRNNASYCSGFGFYLYHVCDSLFEENWADYCCRYEPRDKGRPVVGVHSTGHVGADAAGFVIVYSSCRNIFRRNFARLGGDGFFLAGRSPKGECVGCDHNLFEENDGSLSPNIAFEATFSADNIFRNNWADRCNFGFWLGYSTRNVLEGNRMLFNRQAGIAVEHGVGFQVRNNDFQSNGHGILLWTRFLKSFDETHPDNATIRDWVIEQNRFLRNGTAIAIFANRDHGIRPVPDEIERPEQRPRDNVIRRNDIQDNRVGIHLSGADRTVIEQNKINHNVEADMRREDDRETVVGHNLGLRGAYL
ncbi:MAG: right-handed parallel beta-helix repeat-containing protein [Planctomycetota bacterium]